MRARPAGARAGAVAGRRRVRRAAARPGRSRPDTTSVRTRRTACSRGQGGRGRRGHRRRRRGRPAPARGTRCRAPCPRSRRRSRRVARPQPQAPAARSRRSALPDAHRLLAGAAVDALAQQVGVAAVPGVLLDHVDDDLAQLDLVALPGRPARRGRRTGRRPRGRGPPRRATTSQASATTASSATAPLKSRSRSSGDLNGRGELLWPSMKRRNQWNSTDGQVTHQPEQGHRRRRHDCAAPAARRRDPSHFISKVIRKWSRYSASTAFSPCGVTPVSRGSSSGSTHMSGNWRSVMGGHSAAPGPPVQIEIDVPRGQGRAHTVRLTVRRWWSVGRPRVFAAYHVQWSARPTRV